MTAGSKAQWAYITSGGCSSCALPVGVGPQSEARALAGDRIKSHGGLQWSHTRVIAAHRLWCGHALDDAGLDKWRKATRSGQTSPHLVNLFWEWLQSSTLEVRAQVLQFATGAARLPSNDSSWTFTISEMGSGQYCVIQPTASNGLSGPAMCARASTCAHMIALPPYADLEELRRGMERSLMDGGFGTA